MNKLSFKIKDVFFTSDDAFPVAPANVGGLVATILSTAIVIAGIIVVILLIFAGISMIAGAGQGNPQKVGQGQKAATAAAAGFVIIFVSYWLVKAIELITGVDILQF